MDFLLAGAQLQQNADKSQQSSEIDKQEEQAN